jgi:hypothetical protein
LLEQLGVAQERARGVVGAASPHRNAAGRGIGYEADRMQPFLFVERGCFACRPAGHYEIDACVNLPVNQRAQCLLIN